MKFLRLGVTIIGPLPNIIKDGDLVDAVPVMNDFNWIVSQVNANVPPLIPTVTNPMTYVPAAAVGGSANAITLTPTPAIAAYAEGQSFRFRAIATNTGAVTINTSGLGVRTVQNAAGKNLSGGEIQNGGEYDVCDTGTVYILMNAQTTDIATWTPTLSFGGLAVGITYLSQVGLWTKINNLVWFWFSLQLSSKGTSAGVATIGGLPQTISASLPTLDDTPVATTVLFMATALPASSILSLGLVHGTATLVLRQYPVAGGGKIGLGNFDFNNNTVVNGSGFYPT